MQEFYRFVVQGRVQGVGFRAATQRKALFLGLHGWVRNREDGAVEGAVTGSSAAELAAFSAWLRQGPPGARVDACTWQATNETIDEDGFLVRR